MKNHFPFPYQGNKRKEVEQIYNTISTYIEQQNINTIVEPFCGSCALSYYIWTKNKDKNFKYVLNDNNEYVIQLLNTVKNDDKLDKLIKDLEELYNICYNDKAKYDDLVKKNSFEIYVFKNKYYNLRPGFFPSGKPIKKDVFSKMKNAPIIEFLKNANVEIINGNYKTVYDNYKTNDKAFIILEPPYLASCNSFYKNPLLDIYEYLFNNNVKLEKAYICLCLEHIWIIKLLFRELKCIVYNKIYELSKKETKHVIYTNK